jgi:hypothetical protein
VEAASLHLEIDIGSDPISGSVGPGNEEPTRFCGWIELVEAIEVARHREPRDGELNHRRIPLRETRSKP